MTSKPKRGRPSIYTDALAADICALYADGKSIREIAKIKGIDKTTIIEWAFTRPEFSVQYTRAQEIRAENDADEIIEISDEKPTHEVPDPDGGVSIRIDPAGIQRNKLRVDTRKWIMARRLPKKYGDRQEVQHSGEIKQVLVPDRIATEASKKDVKPQF